MSPSARRLVPLTTVILLLGGCQRGAPAVGVLMSSGISSAARAAHADAAGRLRLYVEPGSPNAAAAALDAAERMVRRRVAAVVGHSNSTASLAASQVYNRVGIVQIAPTTTATVYERAGPYSFRLVPSDRAQARLLARAALHLDGGRAVAVMYENDVYGYGLYRDLQHAADSVALPRSVAAAYLALEDTAELHRVLDAVLAHRPRVLIWLGRPVPLAALMPRLRAAGVHVLGSDALDTRVVHRNVAGTFTGVRFVRLLDPEVQARAEARLAGRVDDVALGAEGLLTYDALRLLGAATAAGADSGGEIREYLLSLGRTRRAYQGITGPIQFDEHRNLQRPWQLARVTASGVKPVREAP